MLPAAPRIPAPNWRVLRFSGLIRAVPKRHVRQFVGHHRRKLRFIIRSFNGAAVDEYKSSRKGKGIDSLIVHTMELPGIIHPTGVEMLNEAMAEFGEIGIHLGIVAHGHFLFDFLRGFAAQFNVLLRREGVDAGFDLSPLGRDILSGYKR
jgi:hypothetical protein